jgi:o-succinylbenzoate synthase
MSEPPALALRRATLEELEMPLRRPFSTSFGTERGRRVLLLSLEERGGEVGYAECVAGRDPLYSYESVGTARSTILDYLLPLLRGKERMSPASFAERARAIRGHPMAKATVEMALWDLAARAKGTPLQRMLVGPRRRVRSSVEVGVSVGLAKSPGALVEQVQEYREAGYHRIKLKVEPGRDRTEVLLVRAAFPGVPLWIDANQAYDGARDIPFLVRLAREAGLDLVEQPFGEDAWVAHARLARALPRSTRLCLDESVTSLPLLDLTLDLGAARALNIKAGRVGGLAESVRLHDRAEKAGIPVWCGGMLETGIGRAHAVHLASLPNFLLPADLSASDRYWEQDLIEEPFRLERGSRLAVPRGRGIGVEPVEARVRRVLRRRRVIPLR